MEPSSWSWLGNGSDYMVRSPLFPNPLVCVSNMAETASKEFIGRMPWWNWGEWLEETWGWCELTVDIDPMMVIWAAVICVVLTAVRAVLDSLVFIPFAQRSKLDKDGTEKLPESIWKCFVYLITWTWSAYITHEMDILFDLYSHWESWYPKQPVQPTVYWLFTFEIGFYLHYMYAMMFLEQRRKDFAVLMTHHILTIILISCCYSVRFHLVGVLLIFIHDVGDVFLEGSKCLNYFKVQDGRKNKCAELSANLGFLLFATEFFLFRIYWFLTKALYSSLHVSVIAFPAGPFYLPFNIMLIMLLGMQVFWFSMIVKLLLKVLVFREELVDIRDIEEEEEVGKGLKENGLTNGSTEHKKKQ